MSTENLFFDAWGVVETAPFFLYVFIGGRGIGKTYSMLKGLTEQPSRFMYVRRTQVELDNCMSELSNPFKAINRDFNRDISITAEHDMIMISEPDVNDPEKIHYLGVAGALSTFGKFRGADFSDIDYILFDEFISTDGRRAPKSEADNFFNMIETVNRNREVTGGKSIKVILLANSNRIDTPIIEVLELGEIIRQMKVNHEEVYINKDRGLYICLPESVPITEKKKETNLYKLTKGTQYFDMAVNNDFIGSDFEVVKRIDNKNLIPITAFKVNDQRTVYFYEIKNTDFMYCTFRKASVSTVYDEKLKKVFIAKFGMLLGYYLENNRVKYSDYNVKLYTEGIFTK